MTALELRGATLVQGGRTVLDRVSIAIPDSGFVGVLGPNGAGKTTLMRAALGLLKPSTGTMTVLGGPPGKASAAIGYMPQTRSLPQTLRLTGRSLLLSASGAGRWGRPLASRADRAAVDQALDEVGGDALADRPIGELSGGERQRLLIAQAIMGEPRLLLLDEPLVSLDPGHQREIVDLVARLAKRRGIAVLFSAHEINPILPVADLILYLGGGRAALGTVDAVVNREVLSRLYGTPVHVARLDGRIFVMAEDCELEHHAHDHDHGHDHGHGGHHHDQAHGREGVRQ